MKKEAAHLKRFFSWVVLAIVFQIGTGCSEKNNNLVEPQSSDIKLDKRYVKVLSLTAQGTVDGIPFTAELQVQKFIGEGGRIYAQSILAKIIGTGLPSNVTDILHQQFNLLVDIAQSSCEILELHLGPLSQSISGFNVSLNQVTSITTEHQDGNVLSNTLCKIAGFTSNLNGSLSAIVSSLNKVIDIVGAPILV